MQGFRHKSSLPPRFLSERLPPRFLSKRLRKHVAVKLGNNVFVPNCMCGRGGTLPCVENVLARGDLLLSLRRPMPKSAAFDRYATWACLAERGSRSAYMLWLAKFFAAKVCVARSGTWTFAREANALRTKPICIWPRRSEKPDLVVLCVGLPKTSWPSLSQFDGDIVWASAKWRIRRKGFARL